MYLAAFSPPSAPTSVPFLRSPSSSSQSLPDFVSSKFFQKVRKIYKLLARLIKTKRCKFEMLEAAYGTIGRGLKIAGVLSYLIPCASSWQNGQFSQKMWTTNIDLRNRMWCSWVGGTMLQRCQSPTVPASLPGNPKGCEFVPIFTFLYQFMWCSERGVKYLCSAVNLFIEGKKIHSAHLNVTNKLFFSKNGDFMKTILFSYGLFFSLIILWV